MSEKYMPLKKGDRVYREFEHNTTGEVVRVYGTVVDDELPLWDWIFVDFDDNPVASLFPVQRVYLFRGGEDE